MEGADAGITATAICPGCVRTLLVEDQIDGQDRAHGLAPKAVLGDVLLAHQAIKGCSIPTMWRRSPVCCSAPSGR